MHAPCAWPCLTPLLLRPLQPYFRATQQEARKVAEVLSHLQGVDFGALMDAAAGGGGGGGIAVGRSRSQSSDGTQESS